MRVRKSSSPAGMCLREPSDHLDVMVLPSTLEALSSADIETGLTQSPERKVSMSSRAATRLADALRDPCFSQDLPAANWAKRDASAVVLQERVRFQLVQRHRTRQAPGASAQKVGAVSRLRRPIALFALVLERFGIGCFNSLTAPPTCAIDLAIERITGADQRPIPPLHSPYCSFSPYCFPQSRYEHGRVLVHAQFERSLERLAAGELRSS